VRSVGLVVHEGRPRAVDLALAIVDHLAARGVEVRSLDGSGPAADPAGPGGGSDTWTPAGDHPATAGSGYRDTLQPTQAASVEPIEGIDMVISVGGDGTLLRSARLADAAGAVPLLSVNVGRLGFLTEVRPNEALQAIDEVLSGSYVLEERLALVARPEGAPWAEPQWAFNEVIVEKRVLHRLITVEAAVDGVPLTRYSADGVIVSTPTGSTAYSFSASGPIVSPRVACLLLTPVAPHMLFDRPVLMAPDETVTLAILGDVPALLSADGRPPLELPVGSRVEVRASDRPVRLVRRKGSPSFYGVLREKFGLPAGQAPHGPDLDAAGPDL
jgi:NAD+ kinase